MKLKNAAHATAQCGFSTRVETTVAIEFAASWRPLMKSNASASATTATRPIPLACAHGSSRRVDCGAPDARVRKTSGERSSGSPS